MSVQVMLADNCFNGKILKTNKHTGPKQPEKPKWHGQKWMHAKSLPQTSSATPGRCLPWEAAVPKQEMKNKFEICNKRTARNLKAVITI